MSDTKPARRQRRQVTDEFKAGAVRLVLDEGKTVGAVARELDLTQPALADWVRKAQAEPDGRFVMVRGRSTRAMAGPRGEGATMAA